MIPLVYNPRSGNGRLDPEALLARLPAEVRSRLSVARLDPPFDYAPWILSLIHI